MIFLRSSNNSPNAYNLFFSKAMHPGTITEDDKMKKEGQVQQAVGDIKETIAGASDAAADLVEKAADLIKGK